MIESDRDKGGLQRIYRKFVNRLDQLTGDEKRILKKYIRKIEEISMSDEKKRNSIDRPTSLVLVRHGQSVWNEKNLFTGWTDVELSEQGIKEAEEAGEKLKSFVFDKAFVSDLKRAEHTLAIILQKINHPDIPIEHSAALNERNYGNLQGLNKDDTRKKYGDEQVQQWRRSFDVRPPGGESLKDTFDRVIPYYKQHILPELLKGHNILVSAHGNSLRALVMFLDELSPEEVVQLNIPTGAPLIYEFNRSGRILDKRYL